MSTDVPARWQVFESIRDREYNSLLFMISRDIDDTVYLYCANRVGDTLVSPFVDISSVELSDIKKKSRLPDVILQHFCGMNTEQKADNVFSGHLVALPERTLRLRLKKEKSRVTASTSVVVCNFVHAGKTYDNLEIQNAEIYNVHTTATFNLVGIPDITSITIYARVPFSEIALALRKRGASETTQKPTTVYYIIENIPITAEMRAQYNPTELFRRYVGSSASAKKTN